MRFSISPAPVFSLCLFLSAGFPGAQSPAHAQNEVAPENTPAQNGAAPAQNGVEAAPTAPARNSRGRGGNNDKNAQRAEIEMRLRVMMTDFGVDEAVQQDAVIAYLAEDEAGKSAMRDAAGRLMRAVRRSASPERTRELIAVYKASLDADKERRRAAQAALDAKIGFSLSPRLEATLWLFGVLGDGQTTPPLNSFAPRGPFGPPRNAPNGKNTEKNNDQNADRAPGRNTRTGIVTGNVTGKGEGWLEVQDENVGKEASIERYSPFWTALNGATENAEKEGGDKKEGTIKANYDPTVSENMKAARIGERVRLEWVWSDRKRVVRLELSPAATTQAEPEKNGQTEPTYQATKE